MEPLLREILLEFLGLVGQEAVYADCGGDYPCGATKGECRHWWDCEDQRKKVEQAKRIRALIGGVQ